MIDLQHVSRWYGQVIGINDVSCRIGSGITALLGPNGAGKSTMMKLVVGQIRPTTGQVLVNGRRPFANPAALRTIGYCPELETCYEEMTGLEFVTLLAALSGLGGSTLQQRVSESIERVGMTANALRKIGGYSKGMRQRIKLAQAIVHRPSAIVLDEPLNGLDPVARREISRLLIELATKNCSILISSHILYEVEQLTENILLMHRGRLLAQGNIYQIRRLIDTHPHRITITTSEPRRLASQLIEMPFVLSARLDERLTDALEIETRSPEEFYSRFPDIVMDGGFQVPAFGSPDNNLEAVFRYLVGDT